MKNLELKRILILFLILRSLSGNTFGQDYPKSSGKSVFITGITYDSKTHEPLPNTIFKVNNKFSFATNESGRFSFSGSPRDTIVFTYMGYQPSMLVIPDSLKSEEYVMGIFMNEQAIKLNEIIILPRMASTSIMINQVKTDQQTMNIAQNNVDKAVVEGLTRAPKVYDAQMNAKKTFRTNQMRAEYKGMLVTPENSVGLSTQSFKTNNIIYGSPIITLHRAAKEMITNSESIILVKHFEAVKGLMFQPGVFQDSIITPNK
jgi:hypothetical protein